MSRVLRAERSRSDAHRADASGMRFRALGAAVSLVGAFLLSACSGGSSSSGSTPTTAPAPGSGVKTDAGGYVGGPVNTARNTVNQLNQQQRTQEQQTGG